MLISHIVHQKLAEGYKTREIKLFTLITEHF